MRAASGHPVCLWVGRWASMMARKRRRSGSQFAVYYDARAKSRPDDSGEIAHVTPEDVRRYGLGSVLNGGGSFPDKNKYASLQDWVALADSYYLASVDTSEGNAGIPIIWGTDAVHGHNNVIGATIFPHNIGLAPPAMPIGAAIAEATAKEVSATGIDWIFAPTVAVALDARWGRTYESTAQTPR